ncbi:hypothetical protein B4U79_18377 [Dinothrombium tinctorium]|uniref:Uncharacterized protein n=1 Tax=Dinothrombium tinctorium TaxID=1965070 RepID=A0A3S3NI93_9ACAR|nr:hypothetical protein B4U79_18445 [Dinothrombium tinctorium]RWS04243.1 hypothetical protein B4U79_18377 [Dinothrombium tinctorium]
MPYYRLQNGSYLTIVSKGRLLKFGDYVMFFENNTFDFQRPIDFSSNHRILLGCQSALCIDSRIDAMLRKKESNNAYIIYGAFVFLWNLQYSVPRNWMLLSKELSLNYRNLDAAFLDSRSNSYYFFKVRAFEQILENQILIFEQIRKENQVYCNKSDVGTPIATLFHRSGFDSRTRIDAAVYYDRFVYIFKGNK